MDVPGLNFRSFDIKKPIFEAFELNLLLKFIILKP